MFEHHHDIAGRQRDRAARTALADHRRDHRHAERKARLGRARDRLGLPALLGLDAGKRAVGVDQRHDGQAEAIGELHQANRLAIALGLAHPEIVLQPARGIVAALVTDHEDAAPAKRRKAAEDRLIVTERAVAREQHEILEQASDIVLEMRPLAVARDLRLLPRG